MICLYHKGLAWGGDVLVYYDFKDGFDEQVCGAVPVDCGFDSSAGVSLA